MSDRQWKTIQMPDTMPKGTLEIAHPILCCKCWAELICLRPNGFSFCLDDVACARFFGPLLSYFDFMALRGESVLTHCRAGKSRSVLYTIAYKMHGLRRTLRDLYSDNPLAAQQRGGDKVNPGTFGLLCICVFFVSMVT